MSQLLEDDQNLLLQTARSAVGAYLSGLSLQLPQVDSGVLLEIRALFVTLHLRQRLRGCIGNIHPTGPLYRSAAECAISAAVNDPRFAPLTLSELDGVNFEISVLSPMEAVSGPEEIEVGTHGLLISKGQARGLLLPQVGSEYKWDRERFLSETCRKAGLRPDDWKQGAFIQRFTAHVFSEQRIHVS